MTAGIAESGRRAGKHGLLFLLTIVGVLGSAPSVMVTVFLLLIAGSPWALVLIPGLRAVRPSRPLVRLAWLGSAAAITVWLLSNLVSIQYTISPRDAYVLRGGTFRTEHYSARLAPFSGRPALMLEWHPSLAPSGFGSSLGLGHLVGGSSRTLSVPIWGFIVAILCPTLLLHDLRRRRLPPGRCATCDYDLTGNLTGRCPECGTPCACPTAEPNRRP